MIYDYYDYVILGAGITGLSIARELCAREVDASILILEKEGRLGAHGSGRNSGVLHSGIYYPEDSLKAKLCAAGARDMARYCDENALPIARIGKLIVPVKEEQDSQINLLYERGKNNGANISIIDAQQLKDLEPEARSITGRALHSPDTAVIDPLAVLEHLALELSGKGVAIQFSSTMSSLKPDDSLITVNDRGIRYGHLYNATGQFSDDIAHRFGIGKQYMLLPFKGIYYQLDKRSGIDLNGLVYPVPDLNVPFLGVHSVKKITGEIFFGPTALPAFGRENYRGLDGLQLPAAFSISYRLMQLYLKNKQGFRQFTQEEASRILKSGFTKAAKALIPNLEVEHMKPSDKVGIRAQLLNRITLELIMDFLVERKDNTTHILNAVSPAFTSAFAFARYITH